MEFTIRTSEKESIALIHVQGDVDMLTSPNLRDALVPFFRPDIKGVVVDLSGVTFMDSSGIATLVEGLQWSRKQNREFVLAGPGQTVMNALSLTKLDKIFTIRPDSRDAFEELNQP
ncbi:STAS domain-containing protein [Desulfospira joergensenii]|uniref:STAS domain-containing protein n=1 Tax=Desulfospira joergensenii TaxID=53329 RepID=UPI0003FEB912|nr:STAS domain-containing protein [Desulfospira joergensenii]